MAEYLTTLRFGDGETDVRPGGARTPVVLTTGSALTDENECTTNEIRCPLSTRPRPNSFDRVAS
jgi:hypothetical protein